MTWPRVAGLVLAVGMAGGITACADDTGRQSGSDPAASDKSTSTSSTTSSTTSDSGATASGDTPPTGGMRVPTEPKSGGSAEATATPTTARSSGQEAAPSPRQQVIVDLNVAWKPESQLTDEERKEQRARIEAAQDQVIADVGSHGSLGRRLTETAQMSMSVDAEGRRILESHRLVKAVHNNETDRPSGY